MDKKEFNKLIKKDKYQVFLFCSPCSLPISFAAHPWITINKRGKLTRYSAGWIKDKNGIYAGKDFHFLPHEGLPLLPLFYNGIKWPSNLIARKEGAEAKKIIEFIERQTKKYPYLKKYHFFPGPNSNTFIQWIINNFPESGFELPWNAFGKNYIKK